MQITLLTATYGWRSSSFELANEHKTFAIEGVHGFNDVSFCNSLAAKYKYHITSKEGVATFMPLRKSPDRQIDSP